MVVEIKDMTGQPRSDEDLKEALIAVNTIMVKHPLKLPLFTINAGIIKDCLIECLQWRNTYGKT